MNSTTYSASKLAEAVKDERYASYAAIGRILTLAWLGNVEEAHRQLEELLANEPLSPQIALLP